MSQEITVSQPPSMCRGDFGVVFERQNAAPPSRREMTTGLK